MAGPLRLAFMGSDPIALPLLEWLARGGRDLAELVGIVTGPDRPSGRGQAIRPNAVKAWSEHWTFPVAQPLKLDAAAQAALRGWAPDVVLVVAYGKILRDEVIALPRLGTLNLHASLLPRYRGASPIQTAVAEGEPETGLTLMRIVRELDAGPIADLERVPIDPLDTAAEVDRALALAAVPLLARALPRLAAGTLPFREQDHAGATFCRRLAKTDGVLDFSAPAARLAARVNGLHPWPAVTVAIAGQPVKLGQADALAGAAGPPPGTVLGADGAGVRVATGYGVLRLLKLQRPGGKMLAAPDFLRGFPLPAGLVLPSAPMPPLVAPAPFPR